ncbi:MAG: peptidoglycan DD-metalloendopeptidase family protein [Candidatus Promineifilaceae bacterium]|nr:peptidoglycan DD-metalloendopeptidase family protein [Candidatus Promineifilaceae bacterium]
MRYLFSSLLVIIFFLLLSPKVRSLPLSAQSHIVRPGDTWTALALRYQVPRSVLLASAGIVNAQQQPAIGSTIQITQADARNGRLLRPLSGGLLQTAAAERLSPWTLAVNNNLTDPYKPILYAPLILPDNAAVPRELPIGFQTLALSSNVAIPGQALMLQARVTNDRTPKIWMDNIPWLSHRNGKNLLALSATGAFFDEEQVLLIIEGPNLPLWEQPWRFTDYHWTYETIEFDATPATDAAAMVAEREQLQRIWDDVSPIPLWEGSFNWPLEDYVELTSHYGARRSINGGGYDTYHEGTDFSAYRGTPVLAPAGGQVVLAEPLTVRGGTVIIDHGLGIHSGYYHLSSITAQPGQEIGRGEILGEVGSTGRSTGNHLHWDLLIGTTWVDAETWMETGMAARIQNAWGAPFPYFTGQDMPNRSARYFP